MSDAKPLQRATKRFPTGENWWSGPTVLYLDDVEEIHRVFARASPSVSLQLDGYQLDTPADASRLKTRETRAFEIHSDAPYATVEASGKEFRVYLSDPEDLVAVGVRDATREVLKKRRLWQPRSMKPYYLLLAPSLLPWVLPRGPLSVLLALLGVAGAVLFGTVSSINYRNFRQGGRVILRDSRSKPSFRQENRDVLLVLLGIVGTIVATVVGGAILYALGLVGKP